MSKACEEQRFRRLLVSPELVAAMTHGTFRVVASSLPPDAVTVGGGYDTERHAVSVTFAHESFDMLTDGQVIPIQAAPWIERIERCPHCQKRLEEEPDAVPKNP